MKKTLLIALFAFTNLISYGQKIHYTDSANVWTFLKTDVGPLTGRSINIFSYIGDTIIESRKYLRRYGDNAFIREDTAANKVYIRNASYNSDTGEQTLYDYNWVAGDTVSTIVSSIVVKSWVTSVSSTIVNSISYKIWAFEGTMFSSTFYYNIIEGIGATNELPFYNYSGESEQLMCFHSNGLLYPLSTPVTANGVLGSSTLFDNASSCNSLSVSQVSAPNEMVTVFPNPVDNTSKVVFPSTISSGNVVVINNLGQEIMNLPFENKTEMQIGDKIKVPDIYFYRVTNTQTGQVFSGKFVRQ